MTDRRTDLLMVHFCGDREVGAPPQDIRRNSRYQIELIKSLMTGGMTRVHSARLDLQRGHERIRA
jgi:hypothetical protein